MYHNDEIMTGWREVMTAEEFEAKEAKKINATTGKFDTVEEPIIAEVCRRVGGSLHAEMLATIEAYTRRYSNIEMNLHWPLDDPTATLYTITDGVRKQFMFLKSHVITKGSERITYLALTCGVLV